MHQRHCMCRVVGSRSYSALILSLAPSNRPLTQFFDLSATSRTFLGGTSLLIMVGVALDTMRQMESQMMMRSYEGFLK